MDQILYLAISIKNNRMKDYNQLKNNCAPITSGSGGIGFKATKQAQ